MSRKLKTLKGLFLLPFLHYIETTLYVDSGTDGEVFRNKIEGGGWQMRDIGGGIR